MAATRTDTLRRLTSSPRWPGIVTKVIVALAILAGLFFAFSSPQDSAPVVISPDESVAEISAPPAVEEIAIQIPQIEKPVIEEIVQIQEPLVIEEEMEPETVQSIQESTAGEPSLALVSDVSASDIPLVQVEWKVVEDSDSIPSEGKYPYTGVGYGPNSTIEREEWSEEILPNLPQCCPPIVTRHRDSDTIGVHLHISESPWETTQPKMESRLFLSTNDGKSWTELVPVPTTLPDWVYPAPVQLLRVRNNGGSVDLFIKVFGLPWMVTTINNEPSG